MAQPESVSSLTLDPLAEAVSAARRYVRERLAEHGRLDLEDSAVLGVSELVTNATIHARTRIELSVTPTGEGALRIAVRDFSAALPRQRQYGLDATTGRGLRLLESLSHRWGVDHIDDESGSGKVVWFEPAAEMTSSGFAQTDWLGELEDW